MNVLIIPEDFRKDQHILKPVISKLLSSAGKPRAKLQVCLDPLLGGVGEAMKWERIEEIIDMYPMVQLFLLIVDRDGKSGRRVALDGLEKKADLKFAALDPESSRKLLAENAWQEIEVWALAGVDMPKDWAWKDVRAEPNPKEIYFEKLAEQRGLSNEPGQGRVTLGREAAQNYSRIKSLCKEDVVALEKRVRHFLK